MKGAWSAQRAFIIGMEQINIISGNKLEVENRELKTVLRKFTHEMGNALTILGASIFYVEADLSNVDKKCDISQLKKDYSYICNLFNKLREYNHAEGIDKKEITVDELIEEVRNSFYKMVDGREIILSVMKQENIENMRIYGDFTKLRQAIINIIKNSIEALCENEHMQGMNLFVGATIEKLNKRIYDKGISDKRMLHIEIRDNGKGISDKHINKIFEPMFTYGKKDGTGLGLSIVKKIIEDHEGKIKAVSALGTGTAMHIFLPIL